MIQKMKKTYNQGNDNALEDYFLQLVIKKHVVDREIQDNITVLDQSNLHPDYTILIKKVLFWENNLYLENWWTLEGNLLDMVHEHDVRGHEIEIYWVVLGIMLRVIEEVFDVDDTYFHDFLNSERKEDIEHRLIILIKRVLDFVETGLREMLQNATHLDKPIIDGHVRKEFAVIRDSLLRYSLLILESEGNDIRELKLEVDQLLHGIKQKKKDLSRLWR